MEIKEFTAGDGYCWRYRHYSPSGPRKAHVVCIHGIQSHSGWYEHSCARLAQAGFEVAFLDRRGAGLNDQDRGDAPGFRRLLDDVAEFIYPLPRPVFLVAVSWGGKLGVALERRHPGLVDGLALVCPGFFPRVRPKRKERFGILLARLFSPKKKFPVPLDAELFTATPRWQQFIRDDPLGLRYATARLMIESVRLDGYLKFCPKYVRAPVLLMLAEHDRIIHNSKTRAFVERFAAADKEIIDYAGAQHTLEFEPEPDKFIGDLQTWLEKRAARFGGRG